MSISIAGQIFNGLEMETNSPLFEGSEACRPIVQVVSQNGEILATTACDDAGYYRFDSMAEGQYRIHVETFETFLTGIVPLSKPKNYINVHLRDDATAFFAAPMREDSINGPSFDFVDPKEGFCVGRVTLKDLMGQMSCISSGSLIATPDGDVPIEQLKAGDLVVTGENGLAPIRWVGLLPLAQQTLRKYADLAPYEITPGALGEDLPSRPMLVSPNHRFLLDAEGENQQALVEARLLEGAKGISKRTDRTVTYVQLMFERHETICVNGVWCASGEEGSMPAEALDAGEQRNVFETSMNATPQRMRLS